MPYNTHELIAATDRQIERTKLRAQRQMLLLDRFERAQLTASAKRSRISLDQTLGELAFLNRYRLTLYHELAFADPPLKKAS
jgi:hypothetical protein